MIQIYTFLRAPLSYLNMIPRVMFGNHIKAGVLLLEMMRAGAETVVGETKNKEPPGPGAAAAFFVAHKDRIRMRRI